MDFISTISACVPENKGKIEPVGGVSHDNSD